MPATTDIVAAITGHHAELEAALDARVDAVVRAARDGQDPQPDRKDERQKRRGQELRQGADHACRARIEHLDACVSAIARERGGEHSAWNADQQHQYQG